MLWCRVVLEMLGYSVVVAAGDCTDGCPDADGCLVRMCLLHQNSGPLTVCHLPQCCHYLYTKQLHWNWGTIIIAFYFSLSAMQQPFCRSISYSPGWTGLSRIFQQCRQHVFVIVTRVTQCLHWTWVTLSSVIWLIMIVCYQWAAQWNQSGCGK